MGLMARVRVPASVGLRALNRRTPARPKSSQQEQDDLQQDNRMDDRQQDDREARDLEARRQDDREANDLLDALDRQGDRRLPPVRRLEPENSLNTLDPTYFEPPPSVDRQQGPDSLDAERANRDKWLKLQRVDIGTLQAVQAERATRLEQAQDAMARARRPTPRQRAQLFDAEQEAKRESVFAEAERRSRRSREGLTPFYQGIVDRAMGKRASIKASRQASRGRRQADAGVGDRPYGGLPKVVVYNDSPGPRAPRSPR